MRKLSLVLILLSLTLFGASQNQNPNKVLVLTNAHGEKSINVVQSNGIPLLNSVTYFSGATTPVNGTSGTGVGFAGPGSIYAARDTGVLYTNSNTVASPTWTAVAAANGTITPTTETVSAAGAISTTKMETTLSNAGGSTFAATLAAPSSQDGQLKVLKMGTATHTVTVAMTNIALSGAYTPTGTTTLTFTNAGDSAVFMAVGSKWVYLGGSAVAS